MSAEFFVRFDKLDWYVENLSKVKEEVLKLETFSEEKGDEFWLSGNDQSEEKDHWDYDVRLIFSNAQYLLVEISSHPKSIERDLSIFFSWFRSLTMISIKDEDGVISNW